MGVLGSVIEPPPHLAVISATEVLERGTVGPQTICHDHISVDLCLKPGLAH